MRELLQQRIVTEALKDKYRYESFVRNLGWEGTKRPKGTPRTDFAPKTYEEFVSAINLDHLSDTEFLDKYDLFSHYRAKFM